MAGYDDESLEEASSAKDERDDVEADEPEGIAKKAAKLARNDELCRKRGIRKQCLEVFKEVEQGFTAQAERSDDLMDFWDIYNCLLGPKQFYTGNSKIFVPIVHNAINARKTRFTNQIFPVSGRYVECTTEDGRLPYATIALAENYVRKAKLRTEIMPALTKNGDVEGQYTIYCSWEERKRSIVRRVKRPAKTDEQIPLEDEVDDIEEATVKVGRPHVEVIADSDLLVLPFTADSLDAALDAGGSVTIIRRWGKAKIRAMMRDGAIDETAGEALLKSMANLDDKQKQDKAKNMVDAAGIHSLQGGGKFSLVYETWTKLAVEGELLTCRAYYAGQKRLLGCKRNPLWCDRLPVISAPVEKVQGSFKGMSKVAPVADLQYHANDVCNEGADSSSYALLPIIMTDPEKNPRVGSMILSMAAVWETSPKDTQFAKFPEMWKDALELISADKNQIFETLGVNPAAITSTASKKKMNQAEVAQEQQVDLLTTADAVTVIEEGILTPLISLFIEMDHQYRDEPIMIRQHGEMGERARMEMIDPLQFDQRYQFRWFGVEAARSAQQIQQQIAAMNVIRGIPPEQLNGYRVNMVPIVTQLCENAFGPRLAPLVFVAPDDQLPVPPETENMLLMEGFDVDTHEADNDDQHIQAHMMALQMTDGKAAKKFGAHIQAHIQQKVRKQQMQAAAQQGQPGVPGGAGPGVAGTPRAGAQPGMPRGGQRPPGAIHQDRLQDPAVMPR